MRKEADYQVTDRITLSISPVLDSSSLEGVPTTGGGVVSDIIAKFGDMITSETLSTFAVISIPDLEKVYELEEEVTFTIRLAR